MCRATIPRMGLMWDVEDRPLADDEGMEYAEHWRNVAHYVSGHEGHRIMMSGPVTCLTCGVSLEDGMLFV